MSKSESSHLLEYRQVKRASHTAGIEDLHIGAAGVSICEFSGKWQMERSRTLHNVIHKLRIVKVQLHVCKICDLNEN